MYAKTTNFRCMLRDVMQRYAVYILNNTSICQYFLGPVYMLAYIGQHLLFYVRVIKIVKCLQLITTTTTTCTTTYLYLFYVCQAGQVSSFDRPKNHTIHNHIHIHIHTYSYLCLHTYIFIYIFIFIFIFIILIRFNL